MEKARAQLDDNSAQMTLVVNEAKKDNLEVALQLAWSKGTYYVLFEWSWMSYILLKYTNFLKPGDLFSINFN